MIDFGLVVDQESKKDSFDDGSDTDDESSDTDDETTDFWKEQCLKLQVSSLISLMT